MDTKNNPIGTNIRRIRKEKGIKQKDLAERLGVAYQNLSGWERGVRQPSTTYLSKIAKVLGVSVDRLLAEKAKRSTIQFSRKELKPLPIPPLSFSDLYPKRTIRKAKSQDGLIDKIMDKFTRKTHPPIKQLLADNEYLKSRINELEKEVKRLKEEKKESK